MSAKQKGPGWDKLPRERKVPAHAKLKNLAEDAQETLWLLLHPVDPEATPPATYEAAMVHLQDEHGISCSVSTFSEWHSWYALKRRMENAAERSLQASLAMAKQLGLDAKQADAFAAIIFKMEALERKDGQTWAAIKVTEQNDQRLEQNEKKLAQGDKKLGHEARRIALLEDKAKRLDELESKAKELKQGGGLSAETLEVIEKQLKLL
jgi:hypothetical protein